jgi:hydroxyacylglutathione hydrolase
VTHREILEDLFFIQRGYLNANHFVYRSEAPILIDTAYKADFDETARLIAALDVSLTDVALIVSTHTHCDHIGGNRIIQERSGCDIALHTVGKHFMDTGDDWSTWWRYFNQEADFFEVTIPLSDGDVIDIGPHAFTVIHTPGHASDGIVLYNPKEKILISADTLWKQDMAVITERVEGSTALHRMRDSLDKLAALDVDIVYPGHGPPFSEMTAALALSRERIERFFGDRHQVGTDLVKKIMVYTLMMKRTVPEDDFFPYLMQTHWYPETVDLYLGGRYEATYSDVLSKFLDRGIVQLKNGGLETTVKP